MYKITIRELINEDILLFKKWLYLPHIAKWYTSPLDWIEEIEARNSDFCWINHFIVLCDSNLISFCQYYEFCNSGKIWNSDVEIDGTYSIDYMIGESDYLKKGFGKLIISASSLFIKLVSRLDIFKYLAT